MTLPFSGSRITFGQFEAARNAIRDERARRRIERWKRRFLLVFELFLIERVLVYDVRLLDDALCLLYPCGPMVFG